MVISTIGDIKLAGRAVNDEWPVDQQLRINLIDQLEAIAMTGKPEMRIAAAKVILSADALNAKKRAQEQKRLDAENVRKLQLIELAVKLGIVRTELGSIGSDDFVAPESE